MPVSSVVTPADRTALVTIETVVLRLALDEADDILLRWIDVASALIRQTLGNRILQRERVVETIYDVGLQYLILERYPIVTLHSVKINGQELTLTGDTPQAWIDTAAAGLVQVNAHFNGLYAMLDTYPYGLSGAGRRQKYEVNHTSGYLMPGSTQGSPGDPKVPDELAEACLEVIRNLHAAKSRPAPGLVSEKLGDASWTYREATTAINSATVQDLLRGYRRLST